jgi:hypothetical protein
MFVALKSSFFIVAGKVGLHQRRMAKVITSVCIRSAILISSSSSQLKARRLLDAYISMMPTIFGICKAHRIFYA